MNREDASYSTSSKEKSSIFQERAEPCPLSSSLYYGGQEDMYMKSSNPQTLASRPDVSSITRKALFRDLLALLLFFLLMNFFNGSVQERWGRR